MITKMKIILITLLTSLLSCCQEAKKDGLPTLNDKNAKKTILKKERDINMLRNYSHTYTPEKIDFSDNDTLNSFDLDYIFNSEQYRSQKKLKDDISNIFLLKLYLHHLKNHNQGFDLLSMRKKEAKYMIDYYLFSNNKDTTAEFINTAYPFTSLDGKDIGNKEIRDLVKEIQIEIGKSEER